MLVEAVKATNAEPVFAPLDASLRLEPPPGAGARAVWAQPVAGLPLDVAPAEAAVWLDQSESLPLRAPACDLAVFGLHLSDDEHEAGALIVSHDRRIIDSIREPLDDARMPDAGAALAQYERCLQFATTQTAALVETTLGLQAACGLDVIDATHSEALAHGVAVQAPPECDAATFYAYVAAENTPVQWQTTLRPLHYRAAAEHRDTGANLARWFLVPVAPDAGEEELAHGVLGIAKAADYLGVRWRRDPQRAAWYADLMQQMYGPGHDAYRPAFRI
jgi:hypothetical protein